MPKTIQNTYNTPLEVSQKYIGFHNIFFDTWQSIVLWQGIFNAHALPPCRLSQKYIGFQNKSFEIYKGIAQLYKETNIIIKVFDN